MRRSCSSFIVPDSLGDRKKKYCCTLLLILVCCITNELLAQGGALVGRIQDEKGASVPYANVGLIKQNDSSLASGIVADSAGRFSLPTPAPGNYFLRFTTIGFTGKSTNIFEVPSTNFSKDFGSIILQQETKALKDVTITALRPTITQLPDRMVVSVEGTAMAAGSTAYQVLAKAPGVFIDAEGNIQLNGRRGITVMIDGKLTYLSARDLRTLLEGMSAENVKNIEIITNPSAKYDAEGTAGILNINLKKNTQQGINGSISAGFSTNLKQNGYTYG